MGIVLPIRDQNKSGFTLVELLTVILIMGMLMLIAVPSFQSASRGGKLRSAAFHLNSSFGLARQTAITSRQEVYLIFPDSESSLYAGNRARYVEHAYRAYALYGQKAGEDGRGGYLSDWIRLPTGVVFDPDFAGPSVDPNLFTHSNPGFVSPDLRFPRDDGDFLPVVRLGFRPDGPIHVGGLENVNSATVYLSDGSTDYDPQSGILSSLFSIEDSVRFGVRVNAITGQSRLREYATP
jgi:prepilin-type N-terminal cleavage/methylation domain-containing protein